VASIICGHCNTVHITVAQVAECARREYTPAPAPTKQVYPASARQLRYIEDLCAKKGVQLNGHTPPSSAKASEWIAKLKAMKDAPVTQPRVHNPLKSPLPFHMLAMIQPGRYAILNDDNNELIFVRVAAPRTGKMAGMIQVQTQHSDSWTRRLLVAPDERVIAMRRETVKGMELRDILTAVFSDQTSAAMLYAEKEHLCARCGKKLTDDRSRWYGIGPECEKHWVGYMNQVEEYKGDYVHGAASV
jgi:hypothetical protein